jgi:hypothetical protein
MQANMAENCIPESVFEAGVTQYELTPEGHKKLMAQQIMGWYEGS